MPKVKDKERILKAARQKKLVTYRGVTIRLSADFSKETLEARRDWQEIFSHEKSGPTDKIGLHRKGIIQNPRVDKDLPREGKTKGVHHHQTIII